MRLYNTAASLSGIAPLRYPIGIPLEPPIPLTRRDLFEMTGKFSLLEFVNFINILGWIDDQCRDVAAILGLPGFPGVATVDEKRERIAEYLGVQA